MYPADSVTYVPENGFLRFLSRRSRAREAVSPRAIRRLGAGTALGGRRVSRVLAWGPIGRRLWGLVDGLGWAGSAAAVGGARRRRGRSRPAAALDLARAQPRAGLGLLACRRTCGWLGDRAKGLAVSVVLTAAPGLPSVGLARAFPGLVAAPAAARARRRGARRLLRRARRARAALQPVSGRSQTSSSQPSCARSASRPACRCATCSSPTRAAARRR